jgi:membrane protein DedA with SNARE-associated domain
VLKILDSIFGVLLLPGAVGHTIGTIMKTEPMSQVFIWSLGAALACYLLGALNLVRAGRPDDKTLATITMAGTVCWALVAFAFGKSIGNVLDPLALIHMVVSIVLVIFGAMTLRSAPRADA